MKNKVIVASKNPVKINAVASAFAKVFPDMKCFIEGVSVPSGIKDQPMSEEETIKGASNRAQNAQKQHPEAKFWVGIEGGLQEYDQEMLAFAWVVVLSKTQSGKGRTASFPLPPQIVELIKQGKELGKAVDTVFGKINTKQKNGAIGLLTGNLMTRKTLFEPAIIIALIPFNNITI